MQVRSVKLSEIKVASYNPASRSRGVSNHARQLVRSIERVGLIYPLAVTKSLHLVDGHRRLAAVKKLGWDTVPVIVSSGDSVEEMYAEVNANSVRLNGNETLQVWLKKPEAVTARAANRFNAAKELVGDTIMQRLAKAGLSLRTVQQCRSVAEYVGMESNVPFVKRCVMWMIKYRNTGFVRAYVSLQHPPKTLYNAIKTGKNIKPKFVVR